jgi:hypothetical protein
LLYVSRVVNPKKPKALRSKPAGISLEPKLIDSARVIAKREGYWSLSAYVRYVLTQAVNAAEQAGQAQIKKAQSKLRRR